jgi:hypothetical protein
MTTDLANEIVNFTEHINRIGITSSDVIRLDMLWGVMTVQLRADAADRLVPAWGDEDTRQTTEHVVDGAIHSYHHRVEARGTNGKVVFLWLTFPAVQAA